MFYLRYRSDCFYANRIKNLIFLIGLDRKSFDNKHVTFEDHIRKVHNMWNYVYFMVLINVKDSTEYTGPESYVHEMIEVCSLYSSIN
jgi:inositol 1,4,5-triphosphate receptor type 1